MPADYNAQGPVAHRKNPRNERIVVENKIKHRDRLKLQCLLLKFLELDLVGHEVHRNAVTELEPQRPETERR
jgi:hypothetical protein